MCVACAKNCKYALEVLIDEYVANFIFWRELNDIFAAVCLKNYLYKNSLNKIKNKSKILIKN